jgi:exonuclease III
MNNFKKFKLLCWNVRGVGDIRKYKVVRDKVRESRCDVFIYQEMKWNTLDYSYVFALYPSYFECGVVSLDA